MTADKEKIIDNLLEEVKELREMAKERAGKKKDWFTAPMIMAYVAILGVAGTSMENCYSRLAAEDKSVKDSRVTSRAHDAVIGMLMVRIDEFDRKLRKHREREREKEVEKPRRRGSRKSASVSRSTEAAPTPTRARSDSLFSKVREIIAADEAVTQEVIVDKIQGAE